MKKDFKNWTLVLVFGLPALLLLFIAGLYFIPCGFGGDCAFVDQPEVIRTPIPTLIAATLPAPFPGEAAAAAGPAKCTVNAETLLSAWVEAGSPESDPFSFTDLNGANCQATFPDVAALFNEANLWYTGAVSCTTCHNTTLNAAAAGMDLSSYAGIVAGSRRASADVTGNDILGGGDWAASKLNDQLFVQQKMPFGRPPGAVPESGPVLLAGQQAP